MLQFFILILIFMNNGNNLAQKYPFVSQCPTSCICSLVFDSGKSLGYYYRMKNFTYVYISLCTKPIQPVFLLPADFSFTLGPGYNLKYVDGIVAYGSMFVEGQIGGRSINDMPNNICLYTKARFLSINDGTISILRKDDINCIDNQIEMLDLHNNNISVIENGFFDLLLKLKRLELWSNRLKNIDLSIFNPSKLLTELNLNYNKLEDLKCSNNIQTKIESLDFFYNSLKTIKKECFTDKLTVINLANNQIESLDEDLFSIAAKSLTLIQLSGNKLKSIPKNIFKGLTMLNNVNLQGNQFTELELYPFYAFGNQMSKIYIDLSLNDISTFTNNYGLRFDKNQLNITFREFKLDYNKFKKFDDSMIEIYGLCGEDDYKYFALNFMSSISLKMNNIECGCNNSRKILSLVSKLPATLNSSTLYLTKCNEDIYYNSLTHQWKRIIDFNQNCSYTGNYTSSCIFDDNAVSDKNDPYWFIKNIIIPVIIIVGLLIAFIVTFILYKKKKGCFHRGKDYKHDDHDYDKPEYVKNTVPAVQRTTNLIVDKPKYVNDRLQEIAGYINDNRDKHENVNNEIKTISTTNYIDELEDYHYYEPDSVTVNVKQNKKENILI